MKINKYIGVYFKDENKIKVGTLGLSSYLFALILVLLVVLKNCRLGCIAELLSTLAADIIGLFLWSPP